MMPRLNTDMRERAPPENRLSTAIAPLEDRMEKVEKIIGIPESQRAFGIFALGYPAEERTQQDRYDETRIHRVTRG